VEKKLNGHATTEPDDQDDGPEIDTSADDDGASDRASAPFASDPMEVRQVPAPPSNIAELADSCIRYVERAVGVKLDYSAETLPLLDHYLAEAEKTLIAQSENDRKAAIATLQLLVPTAGAYFGEVVRRRYASWWRAEGTDPMSYRIEMETVFLAFSPMLFMYEALSRRLALHGDESAFEAAQMEMDEEDQKAAAARLAELEVTEEEYFAPSTRLEAIDVVVDTIRTRRLADGEPTEMELTPEDYET